jgi:hypothetical protein
VAEGGTQCSSTEHTQLMSWRRSLMPVNQAHPHAAIRRRRPTACAALPRSGLHLMSAGPGSRTGKVGCHGLSLISRFFEPYT